MRTPSCEAVNRCPCKDSRQQPTGSRASRKSQDLIAVAAERDLPHAFDAPSTARDRPPLRMLAACSEAVFRLPCEGGCCEHKVTWTTPPASLTHTHETAES